jgi:hypothetical protein
VGLGGQYANIRLFIADLHSSIYADDYSCLYVVDLQGTAYNNVCHVCWCRPAK